MEIRIRHYNIQSIRRVVMKNIWHANGHSDNFATVCVTSYFANWPSLCKRAKPTFKLRT